MMTHKNKRLSPEEAAALVRSGQRVLMGSGASAPQSLIGALARVAERVHDVEVLHLLTLGPAPYADARFEGHLRHNALFIGPNVRGAVQRGLADYTPCFLSEVPSLLRSGRLPVDVAMIQACPPQGGVSSLGVSVDIIKAAVETASLVICQVNPKMPWTLGDSFIREEDIDVIVEHEEELPELPARESTPEAAAIGRYCARLVRDGDTIQVGIGSIPDAVMAALVGRKDLGVHSEMISDGVLDLWKAGVITGKRKNIHPGKIVTSFCMGSRALYAAMDRNPAFEFFPSDYTNNPVVIASHDRMISINSALEVDLTGQVCADSVGSRMYSGVGGQVDFIRGAAWSKGGRSVIALPSTAKDGTLSRIAPVLKEGAGVVTTRADIDFVVTEWGIASLKGKTVRERAAALIGVAHPDHRKALVAEAEKRGFLDAGHVLPLEAPPYRAELETTETFKGRTVFFRPLKPSDLRRLKDLFYTQSPETTYKRYGLPLKRLSERQFQELVAVDSRKSVAIGGFVCERGRERLVAVARYWLEEGAKTAEAAFTVRDDYQGRGIGRFLVDYLSRLAQNEGVEGFRAQVLTDNEAMLSVFRKAFESPEEKWSQDCIWVTLPFTRWKGASARPDPQTARPW